MRHNTKGNSAHAITRFHLYRLARRIAGPVTAYRLANGVMAFLNEAKPLTVVSAGAVCIHFAFVGMGVV